MKTLLILALAVVSALPVSAKAVGTTFKNEPFAVESTTRPAVTSDNYRDIDGDPTLLVKLGRHVIVSKQLSPDNIETVILARKSRHGKLLIRYHTASADSGLNRSFIFEDASGKEIYRSNGSSVKLKMRKLKKMVASGAVRVVTVAIPSDPAKAAMVRVRPIPIINLLMK